MHINSFATIKMDINEEKPDVKANSFRNYMKLVDNCTIPIVKTDRDVINKLVRDEIDVKDEYDGCEPQLLEDMKNENILRCKVCNCDASHECDLQNMENHTNGESCKCSICGTGTVRRENRFQASVCVYTYNIKGLLHNHTPATEGQLKCFKCDYKTFCKNHLKKHVTIHDIGKPFKCSICTYSSNRNGHLSRHMITHGAGGRFECFSCGYKTFYKNDLNKHIKIHSSEKPYKCTSCDYSSIRKYDLKRHMVTHGSGKPIGCFVCGFKTFRKDYLTIHLKNHKVKSSSI